MRAAAFLLIIVSLVAGSLAATTAYAPRVEAVAASGETLTLAAPAGRDPARPDQPAFVPGDAATPLRLTAPVVERLAALQVQRVRVKEFSLGRWDHAWIFAVAMLGLVAGGILIRRESQARLVGPAAVPVEGTASPRAALDQAHRELQALLTDLPALPPDRQQERLIERIDAIQAAHLAPFVAARPALMARHGVAAFAKLMDPFATAERHLNRAWSAAADRVLHESIASLEQALAALDAARARLGELNR